MIRTTLTALALLLATPAFAATLDRDLQPDPEGGYSYTPPETRTDGAYEIEVRDPDGALYARLRSTTPQLDEGKLLDAIEWFHPDGSPMRRSPLDAEGRRHGETSTWDEEGRVIATESFTHGKLDGTSTEFWPSGAPRSERHFVDGQETGVSRRWSEEGDLIRETEFSDTGEFLRDRRWQDGDLVYQRKPVSIEGHGTGEEITEYYGNITETDIKADGYRLTTRHRGEELIDRSEVIDGQIQGSYIHTGRIDNDVTRVEYIDNEPHGLFTRTWRGETLERGMYDHGTRVGEWQRTESYGTTIHEFYDPQGNLDGELQMIGMNGQRVMLETYEHGTLDGPYEERDIDGNIIDRGRYADGLKEGPWREQIPYRLEHWEGSYSAGERQGRWERFDGSGYRVEVAHFEEGLRDGLTYLFGPDGALSEVQAWKQDSRDGYATYYDDGLPVVRDLWREGSLIDTGIPVEGR